MVPIRVFKNYHCELKVSFSLKKFINTSQKLKKVPFFYSQQFAYQDKWNFWNKNNLLDEFHEESVYHEVVV